MRRPEKVKTNGRKQLQRIPRNARRIDRLISLQAQRCARARREIPNARVNPFGKENTANRAMSVFHLSSGFRAGESRETRFRDFSRACARARAGVAFASDLGAREIYGEPGRARTFEGARGPRQRLMEDAAGGLEMKVGRRSRRRRRRREIHRVNGGF